MVRFFNGTGEELRFFKPSDCKYHEIYEIYKLKDDNTKPYAIIPNDQELQVFKILNPIDCTIDWGVSVITNRVCCGIQALPEGYLHYIVSKKYKTAYLELGLKIPNNTFLTPINKVYNRENLLIGYQNLLLY